MRRRRDFFEYEAWYTYIYIYIYEFCHFSTKSTTFTFAMIEEFCSEISSNLVVFCSKYDFSVVEFCSKFRISDSVVKFCSKCRFQQLQNSVCFPTEKKRYAVDAVVFGPCEGRDSGTGQDFGLLVGTVFGLLLLQNILCKLEWC